MPTNLRVFAGPSPHSLADISEKVNTNEAHHILSDAFEGLVSLHIKPFPAHHRTTPSDYFERSDRRGITWSIQVQGLCLDPFPKALIKFSCDARRQGRFLQPQTADDVLFGNIFERPLTLPWGSSAAFQFMKYAYTQLARSIPILALTTSNVSQVHRSDIGS